MLPTWNKCHKRNFSFCPSFTKLWAFNLAYGQKQRTEQQCDVPVKILPHCLQYAHHFSLSPSVGIVTTLQNGIPGVWMSAVLSDFIFLFSKNDQTSFKTHPTSYSIGAAGFWPGLNWSEREANHLPPCSVEVRKEWTAMPVLHLHGFHRDNFTFISVSPTALGNKVLLHTSHQQSWIKFCARNMLVTMQPVDITQR